jgi:hypothetical protein
LVIQQTLAVVILITRAEIMTWLELYGNEVASLSSN